MKARESVENYLEAILVLQETKDVRAIDIVQHLGFSKPSISIAMKKLKEKALITIDKNNIISLTDNGLLLAEKTLEKHNLLTEILISIGVSEAVARSEACSIEHIISDETFKCIKNKFITH